MAQWCKNPTVIDIFRSFSFNTLSVLYLPLKFKKIIFYFKNIVYNLNDIKHEKKSNIFPFFIPIQF